MTKFWQICHLCCCCSVAKSCPTLFDPMNWSTPGIFCPTLSPGFCSDSCPLSQWCYPDQMLTNNLTLYSPFSFALNLAQHQSLFQWIGFLQQVAKVLELQLQHQSFQWILRLDFLYDRLVWSPCSPGDSQMCFPAPQYKSIDSWGFSFL